MHRFIVIALVIFLAIPALAADEPKSEEQKTLYAVGLAVAKQLSVFSSQLSTFEAVLRRRRLGRSLGRHRRG